MVQDRAILTINVKKTFQFKIIVTAINHIQNSTDHFCGHT